MKAEQLRVGKLYAYYIGTPIWCIGTCLVISGFLYLGASLLAGFFQIASLVDSAHVFWTSLRLSLLLPIEGSLYQIINDIPFDSLRECVFWAIETHILVVGVTHFFLGWLILFGNLFLMGYFFAINTLFKCAMLLLMTYLHFLMMQVLFYLGSLL